MGTLGGIGLVFDRSFSTLADITPFDSQYSGATYHDRDQSGKIAFCHDATGPGGSGPSLEPLFPGSMYRSVSIGGKKTQFPSFDVYSYGSKHTLKYEYSESPRQCGRSIFSIF